MDKVERYYICQGCNKYARYALYSDPGDAYHDSGDVMDSNVQKERSVFARPCPKCGAEGKFVRVLMPEIDFNDVEVGLE